MRKVTFEYHLKMIQTNHSLKLMPISRNIKLHITKLTGERPLKCKKSFIHKIHVDRHTLTHTGVQPFQCNDCAKKDYIHQKPYGNRHILIDIGTKRFECSDCGKRFTQRSALDHHKLVLNTERIATSLLC